MPEAPKLHFNHFTEEALIVGLELQICLVLIKACVLFPVPSHQTNAKHARIYHQCYVKRTPQSTFVSASGGQATADLQSPGAGESSALAMAVHPCGSPGGQHHCHFWPDSSSLEATAHFPSLGP